MDTFFSSYAGKKILITGHTGFKGTWLSRILVLAGAKVYGLSLEAEKNSLFSKIENLELEMSTILDIRNSKSIDNYFKEHKFDGIFHLAAQPLVRRSYKEPVQTFETNVMGTVNVLNAVLSNNSATWVIVITSDKVYKNVNKIAGYTEDEPLGGKDPYSASKAATEMVVSAWQTISDYSVNKIKICSVRAGNVIGGGDAAEDRLLPDLIRGFHSNNIVVIRNPNSIRPWQHVLDPLNGYLIVGTNLFNEGATSSSYNFGPGEDSKLTVKEVSEIACSKWPGSRGIDIKIDPSAVHESELLWLSSTLATNELGWHNKLEAREAIKWTIEWEKISMSSSPLSAVDQQITTFFKELQ